MVNGEKGRSVKITLRGLGGYALCGVLFAMQAIAEPTPEAPFTLDFTPDGTGYTATRSARGGSLLATPQSPFLVQDVPVSTGFGTQIIQVPEIVTGADGKSYYHIVVGDEASGFIQETFIQRGFVSFPNGQAGSASAGTRGNEGDPLGSNTVLTGNASANPQRVLVRQIVKDSEIFMEYTKDHLDKKPVIRQNVDTPDIGMLLELDMSNSSYSDDSVTGNFVNTVTLPKVVGGVGDFDYATDKQQSTLSAGRYKWTPGTKAGGSAGTYEYLLDFAAIDDINWESYVEDRPDNVWSYTTNHPNN